MSGPVEIAEPTCLPYPLVRLLQTLTLLFALLLCVAPAVAAEAEGMAPDGRRVALVIGNGAYEQAPVLPNPTNDARDMAAEVFQATDARQLPWENNSLIGRFHFRSAPDEPARGDLEAASLEERAAFDRARGGHGRGHRDVPRDPSGRHLRRHRSGHHRGAGSPAPRRRATATPRRTSPCSIATGAAARDIERARSLLEAAVAQGVGEAETLLRSLDG
jgi:hypothetical protein